MKISENPNKYKELRQLAAVFTNNSTKIKGHQAQQKFFLNRQSGPCIIHHTAPGENPMAANPAKSVKQEDINDAAWAACDTFRGVMDAAGYKDYILVMLFLKYISDVWEDHREQYNSEYRGDAERIRRKLKWERFVLPNEANFYTLYEQRNAPNIGELINIALDAVETANKAKLEGVFRNIDFNSEANLGKTKDRNRRLKALLEDFNREHLNMRPSHIAGDVIGNTYIYLIARFAAGAGQKAGEFYTPHKVSELVAKLCNPGQGARICDPACGSSGLLLEAAKVVGHHDYALYGMEVNGSTWALCRMNMFLHEEDSARIEWCDTLTSPALVENGQLIKFDNIVANPPFSLRKWGVEEAKADPLNRFWRGIPPPTKGDYAFISHMIEAALAKKGRIVTVVPHGVLFRGAAEGRIRQKFIEENLLDAVIGLPGKLFPTTPIPVAIMVFDRSREQGGANERCKNVLFIDASHEYQPGTKQHSLLDEHLHKILSTYQRRKSVAKYAHLASRKELEKNGYNLNIPRYVDTFEEEAVIDIEAVQGKIDTIEGELAGLRKQMAGHLKEVLA